MMIKAIETSYKGYRFRSRLEARWAVFFDAMNIHWEYEPQGYQLANGAWYLPDFFLRMHPSCGAAKKYPGAGYVVEVKGVAPSYSELMKLMLLSQQTKHHSFLVVGPPGDGCEVTAISPGPNGAPRPIKDYEWDGDDPFFALSHFASLAHYTYRGKEYRCVDIEEAAMQARSARFEHGENGAPFKRTDPLGGFRVERADENLSFP